MCKILYPVSENVIKGLGWHLTVFRCASYIYLPDISDNYLHLASLHFQDESHLSVGACCKPGETALKEVWYMLDVNHWLLDACIILLYSMHRPAF